MPCRSADYCIYDEEEVFDYSTYPRSFDSPLNVTDEIDITFDAGNITDEIRESGQFKFSSIFITAPIAICNSADTAAGISIICISCYCIVITCKSEYRDVCSIVYENSDGCGVKYDKEIGGYIAGGHPSQIVIYDENARVYVDGAYEYESCHTFDTSAHEISNIVLLVHKNE